jgi:hypothetical protein
MRDEVAEMTVSVHWCGCVKAATLNRHRGIIFANKDDDMVKRRKDGVTIDDVHNETLALFHRLIQRLEKLTLNCEDPGTINQALKTTADFLVKLNKERENGDDEIGSLLQQTLRGIEH